MSSDPATQPGRSSTPVEPTGEDDPRRAALSRVLASATFSKRPRLREFLAHVGNAALEGRSDEIKEQTLGMALFRKPVDFSGADDNIVRVTARQLRARIDEYYAAEGATDPCRLSIPKGTYVPEFCPAGSRAPTETVAPLQQSRRWWTGWVVASVSAVILILVLLTGWRPEWRSPEPDLLRLMQPGPATNLLIVGADATVQMKKALGGKATSLGEYQSSQLAQFSTADPESASIRWMEDARLFGVGNVPAITKLTSSFSPGNVQVRHPRQVSEQDFVGSNAILLSGPFANPWVQLFEPKLNFQIVEDASGRSYIRNARPRPGEATAYRPEEKAGAFLAYSRIALLPNLSGHGKILLIGGPSSSSLEVLANKAGDPAFWKELASRLGMTSIQPVPPFEVVVEILELGRAPSKVEIVAARPAIGR